MDFGECPPCLLWKSRKAVHTIFFSFKRKAVPRKYMHPYTLFLELPVCPSSSVKLLILACLRQERCPSQHCGRRARPLRSPGLGSCLRFPSQPEPLTQPPRSRDGHGVSPCSSSPPPDSHATHVSFPWSRCVASQA